jgi:3-hydroxyacyl-CoA dehydrogenase
MSADRGSPVALRVAGGIASVRIDHPPVNALSRSVRAGLLAAFEAIAARDDVRAVVLECAGRTFVAGADIREFGRPPEPPSLREVFDAIEQCERPVVAAIHGTALGGGLELALCCHRRLCTASARVGLPEVRLGILPGAGGTQRLPRLIGAEAALDLMLTGRHVPADEAASLGLIDAVVDEPLDASARQHAEALAAAGSPPRRVRDLAPREPDGLSDVLAAARERAARELRGQHAPARIVECVAAAFERPFEDGLAFEREQIRAAFADPQSAALRHVFFAERAAVRVPDLAAEARARPIARAGVVGGGTMGRGIAIALAEAGIDVTVIEATPDALAACRREIGRVLRRALDRGRIDERGLTARLDRVTGSVDLAALAEADIVIEAVYENLALKTEVFAHVDRVVRPRPICISPVRHTSCVCSRSSGARARRTTCS